MRLIVGLALVLYVTACDAWHLSVNSDGLVLVSVIDGGTTEPRHRFRLRTRDAAGTDRTLDIPESGQVTLTPVARGAMELTLLSPEECVIIGSNPRRLNVYAGEETRLTFEVLCDRR